MVANESYVGPSSYASTPSPLYPATPIAAYQAPPHSTYPSGPPQLPTSAPPFEQPAYYAYPLHRSAYLHQPARHPYSPVAVGPSQVTPPALPQHSGPTIYNYAPVILPPPQEFRGTDYEATTDASAPLHADNYATSGGYPVRYPDISQTPSFICSRVNYEPVGDNAPQDNASSPASRFYTVSMSRRNTLNGIGEAITEKKPVTSPAVTPPTLSGHAHTHQPPSSDGTPKRFDKRRSLRGLFIS